jgi:uncharacterized protein
MKEIAFSFDCKQAQLAAVLHLPSACKDIGVVVVVGGPQYRVGSHRQFILLARELAAADFAVLRFDYGGMGDSDGELLGFEHIDMDIRADIDELMRRVPSVKRIALWGLCDGATAASFYAPTDARVVGLTLLNPWVRSDQTLARSLFFHYYRDRLFDFAAWRRLLLNPKAIGGALGSIGRIAKTVLMRHSSAASKPPLDDRSEAAPESTAPKSSTLPLIERMSAALHSFSAPILLILSGVDITANEFVEGVRGNRRLHRRLQAPNVTRQTLDPADHTFSRREWRDRVAQWTREWLRSNYQ